MKNLILAVMTAMLSLVMFQEKALALLLVNDSSDLYVSSIGNYAAVSGTSNTGKGNTGNLLNISTAQNGSVAGNTHNMSVLCNILTTGGLSSTNVLVFGLDINETGPANGNNTLDVNTLTMTFNNTPFGNLTYNLGDEVIRGGYYQSGASNGEILFQVNLGFDFLARYNSASTDLFSISSKLTGGDDGDDRYFLSSGFTENPPVPLPSAAPEPATMVLFGIGGAVIALLKRKRA